MLFYSQKEDNVITVVYRALSLYKVKITRDTVCRSLKPNSDYPSLKSVCDFLKDIKVECFPVRIDEKDILKISEPFIAHLNSGVGEIILIKKISDNKITYADSLKGWKQMTTDEFLKKWSRVVIYLEPSEKSGEKDFDIKKKEEIVRKSIVPFIAGIFFLVCGHGLFTDDSSIIMPSVAIFILALTKSTGLFFSLLLLRSELNIKTEFTDKLCHLSTNVDCNAVTKSKASRIFGSITWADAGVTYFAGGLILMFILPYTEAMVLFSVLSVAALPYPVFSILYQGIKIKKWCPMCLSVKAVLIGEFFLLFKNIAISPGILSTITPAVIVFSLIFLIDILVKLLYTALKDEENNYQRLMKMKRNPAIFLSHFNERERVCISGSKSSLDFGDKNSPVAITVFLSFYCSFCEKKFKTIKSLIDDETGLNIRLVFAPPKDELSAKLTNLICSMMDSGEKSKIPELIEKWYDSDPKQKSEVLNGYQIIKEDLLASEFIDANTELFNQHNIEGVPMVFVNDYPMPETYELSDLLYFTDEIKNKLSVLKETKNKNERKGQEVSTML